MHITRNARRFSVTAAALGFAALTAMPVGAAVLASDGFDTYTLASPVGQTPSTGSAFTGFSQTTGATQTAGSDGVIASGDLGGGVGNRLSIPVVTTPGGASVTVAVHGALDVTPAGPFSTYLDESGKIGKDGTTLYVSLTFQVIGTEDNSVDNEGTVIFSGGDSSFYVGKRFNTQNFQTYAGGGSANKILGTYDTDVHTVVLRIDFQSGADTITTWLDPDLQLGESDAGQVAPITLTTAASISFSELVFQSQVRGGNSTPSTADFDRVVFSDSFPASPIPEPSSALAGLAVTGLFLVRRRRVKAGDR